MSPRTIATLRHAENFVKRELEIFRASWEPTANAKDRELIADAENLLRALRRTITREQKRKTV